MEKFPYVGSVIIEDDVEISANTCIDLGSIGDTYISKGARIDNLVHVAHNVQIGKHTAVIANVMIGGSTRIEDFAWLAPSACLRNKITIGTNVTVGLAALITKDVPANETVLRAAAKESAVYKLLTELTRLTQASER